METSGYTENEILVARTIWGEARGEGELGMRAAADVIVNRWAMAKIGDVTWWGSDLQSIAANGVQFNPWRENDPNYHAMLNADDANFAQALKIARDALQGTADITQGATHFYNPKKSSPDWGDDGPLNLKIGRHKFTRPENVNPTPYRTAMFITLPEPNEAFHDKTFMAKFREREQTTIAAAELQKPIAKPQPEIQYEKAELKPAPTRSIQSEEKPEDVQAATTADKVEAFKQNATSYRMKTGDTVSNVALKNGVAQADMDDYIKQFEALNEGVDADEVYKGRTYQMPSFQKPVEAGHKPTVNTDIKRGGHSKAAVTQSHGKDDIIVAQPGDTLTSIVKQHFPDLSGKDAYQTALDIGKKGGFNPNRIRIGQEIDLTP